MSSFKDILFGNFCEIFIDNSDNLKFITLILKRFGVFLEERKKSILLIHNLQFLTSSLILVFSFFFLVNRILKSIQFVFTKWIQNIRLNIERWRDQLHHQNPKNVWKTITSKLKSWIDRIQAITIFLSMKLIALLM